MRIYWFSLVGPAVMMMAGVAAGQGPGWGGRSHGDHSHGPPPQQPFQQPGPMQPGAPQPGAVQPPTYSPDEAEQRFRRSEFFLQELDANRNGVIEAEEVDGRRKYYVDRLLERAGLEVKYPVAVSRVRDGLQRYYQAATVAPGTYPAPGMSPWGYPPGTFPQPGMPPGPQPPGATPNATAPPPLVPGFGLVATTTGSAVRGFGGLAVQPAGTAARPAASAPASSLPPPRNEEEAKVRQYAKSLLEQYDKNKNNVLDRDEWSQMKGDVKAADTDNNGIITLDELTLWLMKFSHNHSRSGGSGGSGGSSSSTSISTAKRLAYRFSTATERLPAGLPDWFLQKDADGDGQVSMAEFTSDWTEARVPEFKRYDLNDDGMITAWECLAVEKTKEKEKKGK